MVVVEERRRRRRRTRSARLALQRGITLTPTQLLRSRTREVVSELVSFRALINFVTGTVDLNTGGTLNLNYLLKDFSSLVL